jgi:hypothetical protein
MLKYLLGSLLLFNCFHFSFALIHVENIVSRSGIENFDYLFLNLLAFVIMVYGGRRNVRAP